jgi:hypothetical protein
MRVKDELVRDAAVEVLVTPRRLVERNNGRVYRLRDLGLVVQDHLHQLVVVSHHRALSGDEAV